MSNYVSVLNLRVKDALRHHKQYAETEEQRRAAALALEDIETMENQTKPDAARSVQHFEPLDHGKPSGAVGWLVGAFFAVLFGAFLVWWVL